MSINSISGNGNNKSHAIDEQLKNVSSPVDDVKAKQSPMLSPTGDIVSLTGTAEKLRSLEEQLATQPVVDAQRVESIRGSIANGTYEINPQQVADKMIQIESAISDRLK